MIKRLKTAAGSGDAVQDKALTKAVEDLLEQVETGGDRAVRALANRFDGLDRPSYRLSDTEIQACVDSLTTRQREDIEFAQAQVRNFAQAQRAALRDIEVETLPGVVLGHRNIPIANVGCYVPGGKYPLLASAHMSVVTAKVAGCERIITCAPPFKGELAPLIVAAQHLGGADEI